MLYAELKPGDVLLRDGRPIFLVIRCSPQENDFAWVPLTGKNIGRLIQPDLARVEMWNAKIHCLTILHCDV